MNKVKIQRSSQQKVKGSSGDFFIYTTLGVVAIVLVILFYKEWNRPPVKGVYNISIQETNENSSEEEKKEAEEPHRFFQYQPQVGSVDGNTPKG